MYRMLCTLMIGGVLLSACGGKEAAAPVAAPPAVPAEKAPLHEPDHEIPMRNFASLTIGPYEVQPMFEEEIVDGHYNLKITGAEVKAVRVWVGPEDASGVMVVKGEIENDYHHHHVEVPNPVPAGTELWIEIETPDGETLKGSTPLVQAG